MNGWFTYSKGESTPVVVGVASVPGRVRDENEDAYGHFWGEDGREGLFVVADGMGGHVAGEKASALAVSVIRDVYFDHLEEPVDRRLRHAFRRANKVVHAEADTNELERSMGTTATALALGPGQPHVAHVGDSRAYRFWEDEGRQLTRDHTIVERKRREGLLTDAQARTHPRRGTLTRAIGVQPSVEIELVEVEAPRIGDHFLLCTDGLQGLSQDTLRTVILEQAPQAACEHLVELANEQGGYDNATALVVQRTQ